MSTQDFTDLTTAATKTLLREAIAKAREILHDGNPDRVDKMIAMIVGPTIRQTLASTTAGDDQAAELVALLKEMFPGASALPDLPDIPDDDADDGPTIDPDD